MAVMNRCFTRWNKLWHAVRPGAVLIAFALLALLAACGKGKPAEKTAIRIGVALYRNDDTFINDLRKELELRAKSYEQETGRRITLDIQGAKGSQSSQNRQIERFVSLGADVLLVNPVDRMAVSSMIDQSMEAGIPIVFFNREPSEEDMARWNRLCYVGVDARETAVLQGQLVADIYRETPEKLDKNRDGKVRYVLLEGETSHQDSLIRTEWSVRTMEEKGVPISRIAGAIASWERSQASALMEQWLKQYPGQIELVLSNNDDMALGALDAMERSDAGQIVVVGIDGTENGMAAVREGKMIGTVLCEKAEYAEIIFEKAIELVDGKTFDEENCFWCSQRIFRTENF